MVVEEGSAVASEDSAAAAAMDMVEDATAATTDVDILVGAGATGGAAEVGGIQVTVGVGDLGLAWAGDGHTGMHTITVTTLGGDTRILTTIRIVLPVTNALITGITGTTILRHQITGHNPGGTGRLLRDDLRRKHLRPTRPVIRIMIPGDAFFPLTGSRLFRKTIQS